MRPSKGQKGVPLQRWGRGSQWSQPSAHAPVWVVRLVCPSNPDLRTPGWFFKVSKPGIEGSFLQAFLSSLPPSFLYEVGLGESCSTQYWKCIYFSSKIEKFWLSCSFKEIQTLLDSVDSKSAVMCQPKNLFLKLFSQGFLKADCVWRHFLWHLKILSSFQCLHYRTDR